MKIEPSDGRAEREVLAGMVMSGPVLGRIASRWGKGKGLFASRWANLVGGWCVEYWRRHEKAPGRHLESLFSSWAEKSPDDDMTKLVEQFLSGLSSEYERSGDLNPEHIVDRAGELFARVQAEDTIERMRGDLEAGKPREAIDRALSLRRVELGSGADEDLLTDEALVKSIFERQAEPLITYPGDLGKFFGPVLGRDRFVAFLAPEKTGKSWFLMDLAWRAIIQRRRVAYFEAGDDHEETRIRFMVRAAKWPDQSTNGEWPCIVKWPRAIRAPAQARDGESPGVAEVKWDDKSFPKPLDAARAWKACERFMTEEVKSKKSWLKLRCHPSKSLSVPNITATVQSWKLEGWIPDVVIVDYADILAPIDGRQEKRHQEDDAWAALRALSQREHILVATATQASKESYGRWLIDRKFITEDKRKLAHASAVVGINVAGKEKVDQIFRLNWIVRRKGAYFASRCIHVAGCLGLANPAVLSSF